MAGLGPSGARRWTGHVTPASMPGTSRQAGHVRSPCRVNWSAQDTNLPSEGTLPVLHRGTVELVGGGLRPALSALPIHCVPSCCRRPTRYSYPQTEWPSVVLTAGAVPPPAQAPTFSSRSRITQ